MTLDFSNCKTKEDVEAVFAANKEKLAVLKLLTSQSKQEGGV